MSDTPPKDTLSLYPGEKKEHPIEYPHTALTPNRVNPCPWEKRDWIAVILLLLFTVLFMWRVVPPHKMSTELHPGDGTQFAYILGWGADSWWRRPLDYYNTPFFYPHKRGLANTDGCVMQAILVTPIWVFTHNFILTNNFALYLATFFSLFAVYYTLRKIIQVSRFAALTGAVLSVVNSDRYWHITGHLNLIWNGILALGLLSGWYMALKPNRKNMILMIIIGVASLLFSWYFFVLTGFCIVLGFSVARIAAWKKAPSLKRSLLFAFPALIFIAILISPIAHVYYRAKVQSKGEERGGIKECVFLSASVKGWFYPADFPGHLVTSWARILGENHRNKKRTEDSQFIGYGLVLLLILETLRLLARGIRRKFNRLDVFSLFCLVFAILAFLLSLGPYLAEPKVKGPYYYLHVLILQHTRFFRNPSRFSFIFQLLSGMSAAVFLSSLTKRSRKLSIGICTLVIMVAFFEHWPVDISSRWHPTRIPAIDAINEFDKSGEEPFVMLPDPRNCYGGLSTYPGWRPMVNGFSSSALFPDYDEFFLIMDDFPSTRSLANIVRRGAEWIVLNDPRILEKAKKNDSIRIVKNLGSRSLLQIREPEKMLNDWDRHKEALLSEMVEKRKSIKQTGRYHILADFTLSAKQRFDIWRAKADQIPGQGLIFKPTEKIFGSFFIDVIPRLDPALFDSIGLIFLSEKEYPDFDIRVYWSTGEDLSEKLAIDAEITWDETRRVYVAKFHLHKHPFYFYGDSINRMRFDFRDYPSDEEVEFIIKGVMAVKDSTQPKLPDF